MGDTDRFSIPFLRGTIAGVVVWIAGYFAAYLLAIDEVRGDVRVDVLEFLADEVAEWKLVGWAFYNAHAVDVRIPEIPVGFGRFPSMTANHVAANEGSLWPLYLAPPIALLAAGFAVAWWGAADRRSLGDGALAGSTITVGYLLACIGGLLAFTVSIGDGTARLDPIPAVALAGVVYPLVFGSAGGLLAAAVAR